MHRLTKSVAMSNLVALTTATTAFAQITSTQNLHLSQRASFNCGSHLRTYVVKSLDNRAGTGIRCVGISDGQNNTIPQLAWYGEGDWRGATYRHVGHAFKSGSLVGSASDIYGNGEDIKNNYNKNLKVEIVNSSTIRVTGAWNEEWQLVKSTNYNPLSRPKRLFEKSEK
jgi:hypothetical protein